ncbi:uncharacterized protein [Euphorbia lathyris]|uniref:uncharacterized protein n=1 Tax=Euphorbia lathyris TaxID=212925 RepID=UPI003313C910
MKVSVSVLSIFYFVLLCYSSSLSISDVVFNNGMDGTKMTAISRKLKEKSYNPSIDHMNLEDYNPIDPVPSSKASIKPGPIEHGTPLNPYIPKRSPPSPPPSPLSPPSSPPSPPHPKKVAEIP